MAILTGTDQNDTIRGTLADDIITGRKGDDELFGLDGNDLINGRAGVDLIIGGDGNDRLHGGADDDRMEGGRGDDRMWGDAGDDIMLGGNGSEIMLGRDGDDELFGDQAFVDSQDEAYISNDVLIGGIGDDILHGGPGRDTMTGNHGEDVFRFDMHWRGDVPATYVPFDGVDTVITDFVRGQDKLAVTFQRTDAGPDTDFRDVVTLDEVLSFDDLDTNNDGVADDSDDHISVLGSNLTIEMNTLWQSVNQDLAVSGTITLQGLVALREGDFAIG